MGDTKIVYDEKFGIATFKREICAELGETFWNELVRNAAIQKMSCEIRLYLKWKRDSVHDSLEPIIAQEKIPSLPFLLQGRASVFLLVIRTVPYVHQRFFEKTEDFV